MLPVPHKNTPRLAFCSLDNNEGLETDEQFDRKYAMSCWDGSELFEFCIFFKWNSKLGTFFFFNESHTP